MINVIDGAVECYAYGPFGEVVRASGPMAGQNPSQFSTKYTDAETGLNYYGYRYYNPSTGRWISRDPIGENGGLNLMSSRNNPVSQVNSLGLRNDTRETLIRAGV